MHRFLIFCLLVPGALHADPAGECPGSSQIEIGQCVAETLERADSSLETILGFARASAEELDTVTERSSAVPALEASQEAWQAYRDAQCDYEGALFGGGSGTSIGINACRIVLTREREQQLLQGLN